MPLEPSGKTWDPAEPVQAVANLPLCFRLQVGPPPPCGRGSVENRERAGTPAARCRSCRPGGDSCWRATQGCRVQPSRLPGKLSLAGRRQGRSSPRDCHRGLLRLSLVPTPSKAAARLKKPLRCCHSRTCRQSPFSKHPHHLVSSMHHKKPQGRSGPSFQQALPSLPPLPTAELSDALICKSPTGSITSAICN